jgi:hypothetical protein
LGQVQAVASGRRALDIGVDGVSPRTPVGAVYIVTTKVLNGKSAISRGDGL